MGGGQCSEFDSRSGVGVPDNVRGVWSIRFRLHNVRVNVDFGVRDDHRPRNTVITD